MKVIDHSFVICAYKESEHLEKCIISLKKQTVPAKIKMVTSTPNDHIRALAEKYDIPLYVREGASDIRDDWNYAYDHADSEWMTVAHQDDMYDHHYLEELSKLITKYPDALLAVTDYIPIKKGQIGPRDTNCKIQKFLRWPLKFAALNKSKFWKTRVLSLGSTLKCPCACYHKALLGPSVFTSELKFCIDWDTFYKIARMDGRILLVDKPLFYYRVYDGATSKEWIVNHTREREDRIMFEKFWPKWLVGIIMHFYKNAYKMYD
ncbi:MAG: glycosyltransferase family 2 protein [Lachnospiraceae bacterium]|nr:glycosyltransferase family 2 protein [Lachnospiraceae bacterium]